MGKRKEKLQKGKKHFNDKTNEKAEKNITNQQNEDTSFWLNVLNQKIDDINRVLIENHIVDLSELLGNRKKLFFRNLGSGIAKGIGIGMGVTVITAILVILLQKIVTLNIPVIGEYIADIVDIVERSR